MIRVGSFAVLSIIPLISFRVCQNQKMRSIPGKILVQHRYLSFCCNSILFMGGSLYPIMVDGATHHHQDRLSLWRQTVLFDRRHLVSEKSRLLFPHLPGIAVLAGAEGLEPSAHGFGGWNFDCFPLCSKTMNALPLLASRKLGAFSFQAISRFYNSFPGSSGYRCSKHAAL